MKGNGWYIDYITTILKYYPQFNLEWIEDDLNLAFGWILINKSLESDGWLNFCGFQRTSPSYIEQEIDCLMKQYYDSKKRKVG